MGHMQAFTEFELEAQRRREVVHEELVDARIARRSRLGERHTSKRDLAWLAASATLAGQRLVRG